MLFFQIISIITEKYENCIFQPDSRLRILPMPERRKSPRYPIFMRVYFPEHDTWGYTTNASLEGCFVVIRNSYSTGFITEMILDLPVIGPVLLKGYIHHKGKEPQGLGMQFVQVRFSKDESEYFKIYAKFIKSLDGLRDIKEEYIRLTQEGKIKLLVLPPPGNEEPFVA